MVKYLTPGNVTALLMPAADTTHTRLQSLLTSVYEMQYLQIMSVDDVKVINTQFQVPIQRDAEIKGTLEKLQPTSERTLGTLTMTGQPECWADMQLSTRVAVKVAVTQAALEKVSTTDLSDITSLADFQSRFDFIDVQDFMAYANLSTLQQLKAEFPRLFQLQFAQPPPYVATDPAALRNYPLTINALFASTIDLVDSLRSAKSCRRASERSRPYLNGFDGGDVRVGSAWMVVFDQAAVTTQTPSVTDITSLLAGESVVAAFDTA